ncbi:MAG TPA: hypothetical protein VEW28_00345 [Candidatus Kapabacteria bacterium]|nr:hypothetical protein [Candidatus Kapabacteria bacterium]
MTNRLPNTALTVLALILCLICSRAFSQTSDASRVISQESRGSDFWLCFPQNAQYEKTGASLTFRLFITSDKATTGTVSIPGLGITKRFSLNGSEVITVDVDSVAQVLGSDQIQKVGVHVTADNPIAVYGLSHRQASTDTYLGYPTNTLGTVYRAVGYHPLLQEDRYSTQVTWVATQDNTLVTITLVGDTRGGRHNGETYSISMNQGDVYQIQSMNIPSKRSDLTGTLVVANKPIAFFTGHTCAQVPVDVSFCNQLLEMEPPVPSWGRQFYVGRMEGKTEYAIRVIANEPNTDVFLDNRLIAKLPTAGDFYENNHLRENTFITTNKPVIVAQYAQGSEADTINKIGDPCMLFITPTEQFLKYYRFTTPVNGSWHHFVNLVVPTDALPSLRLDGNTLSARYFKTIGISKYAIAQVEVGYASHSVQCDKPFGLYSYGFGVAEDNFDAYANNGGQLVQTVPDIPDTIKPELELVSEDANGPLALIARDDRLFDAGLASITVIDSANFKSPVNIPAFDKGTPELPLFFRIRDTGICGFMSLRIVDAAKNEAFYVICRTQVNNQWTYQLYEGQGQLCPSCKSWTVQFTATPSATISNVTFNPPGYLKGGDVFNNFTSQLSGGFAFSYIYPFSKKNMLSGGIGYSSYNGTATALHSSFANDSIFYGDTAGSRKIKVVEQFATNVSLNYLSLHGGFYHYFVPEKSYIYAGLSADILLSATYNETSEILYPATLDYNTSLDPERKSTGSRTLNLASGNLPQPTKFQLALEIAPGLQFKLNKNFSLLTALYVNMPLLDAVRDLNWHLSTFGARLGLQYRH